MPDHIFDMDSFQTKNIILREYLCFKKSVHMFQESVLPAFEAISQVSEMEERFYEELKVCNFRSVSHCHVVTWFVWGLCFKPCHDLQIDRTCFCYKIILECIAEGKNNCLKPSLFSFNHR